VKFLKIIVLLAILATTGCSTVGVYDDKFTCPATYNGRCISVPGAYDLAKKGQDGPEYDPAIEHEKSVCPDGKCGSTKVLVPVQPQTGEGVAQVTYKESLYKRFDSLLKEPTTPVVAPPQVMRVLLLPYKGEGNELYMLRYVYFFVDEPKWILGDSVVAPDEEENE
jgi:conjugal transfer pilus assembly protein TraV